MLGTMQQSPLFSNATEEVILPFEVVAVTEDFQIIENMVVFRCETPSTTFTDTYLVNGPVAVQPGKNGNYQTGPLVRVRCHFGEEEIEPAFGQGWGPKPGSRHVHLGYPMTARVMGMTLQDDDEDEEEDLDYRLAMVRWKGITGFWGLAQDNYALDATNCELAIRAGHTGDGTETGIIVSDLCAPNIAIVAGNKYSAYEMNGRWELTPRGCP